MFLLLNYTLFLIGGIKTEFMGEQRVVVGCPLHSRACLSACSELVRWRQCTKYVLQLVCGQLLLTVLLVRKPPAEKNEVITYKELNWSRVLKIIRSVCCIHYLCFSVFKLLVLEVFLPFSSSRELSYASWNIRYVYTGRTLVGRGTGTCVRQHQACPQNDTHPLPGTLLLLKRIQSSGLPIPMLTVSSF